MRNPLPILCLVLSALSLAACGHSAPVYVPPVEVRLERVTVPAELLTCMASPAKVPAEPWPTNDVFIPYVMALEIVVEDCRGRLAEIRRLMDTPP